MGEISVWRKYKLDQKLPTPFKGTSVVKWGIIISALLWIAIFPPLILVKELKRTKFGSQSSQNFDSIPSPSGIPVPDSFLNQPASTSLVVTIT